MGRPPQPGHGRMRNRLKVRAGREWLVPQRMWPTPATCPIASTMIVWQQDMSQRWRLHQKGAGRIVDLIDLAARVGSKSREPDGREVVLRKPMERARP